MHACLLTTPQLSSDLNFELGKWCASNWFICYKWLSQLKEIEKMILSATVLFYFLQFEIYYWLINWPENYSLIVATYQIISNKKFLNCCNIRLITASDFLIPKTIMIKILCKVPKSLLATFLHISYILQKIINKNKWTATSTLVSLTYY